MTDQPEVRQVAHASGEARINQAARDLHMHYPDGVRRVRRAVARECPYPGLASFSRKQARWFFGRDQLTAELTARLDARLSPDGRTLATGSHDRTVRLWNVTDPAHPALLSQPLTGHTGAIISAVFSPDGRTLATGGHDQTVRLWDVTDPAHPTSLGQPLTGHTGNIAEVLFSPDGRTLASSSGDQTVRLWGMNVDQAIQRICANTRNTFTPEKWTQYVSPDLRYDPPCR